MIPILKIAKTELQVFFYSPVAWIILVIFAFQSGIIFTDAFDGFIKMKSFGLPLSNITTNVFTGPRGLHSLVQSSLYLYIPLLTMGVMSRELSSGSIKLLYSSPVTNYQIIFGKYLALVTYALVIVGSLCIFSIYGATTIQNIDYPLIFCGLLGLFFLTCAYAAIGLFMSSLTSYTVVAAMGTLAILSLLAYVKTVGQEIAFVRDVTYWLAISGRSDTFIKGLITTEDVIYFIMVIGLFISFSIIKLQVGRQKSPYLVTFSKYAGVTLVVALVGFITSMPKFKKYFDVTYSKVNTLTKSSQNVVGRLNDGLTIHTYINMLDQNYFLCLPRNYKEDMGRFENYLRFKPDIKIEHHYYYHRTKNNPSLDKVYPGMNDDQLIDTLKKLNNWTFPILPYSEIKKHVDLEPESYTFVRLLETNSGKRTFLRIFEDNNKMPSETEITAAFKRLVMDLPLVGFVKGHNERQSDSKFDRGYKMIAQEKSFRYALINQGFDFANVMLDKEVPEKVRILVIAEPRKPYTAIEMQNLSKYIAKGGNLIVAGDPERKEYVNALTEQFGVKLLPGLLVKPTDVLQPDLMILNPTAAATHFSYHLANMYGHGQKLTMPGAAALAFDATKGFQSLPLFSSDSTGSWNELETKNFVDDSVSMNKSIGEIEQAYPTVLALGRKINNKEQKIIVTGDADWLSNAELGMTRNTVNSSNFSLINAAFYWMSDGEVPIDMRREPPIDRDITANKESWGIAVILLKWVFPALLILIGVLIWVRRRGK